MREKSKGTYLSNYPWYEKSLAAGKAMQHDSCLFQSTRAPSGSYVIHPDWCSEKLRPPATTGRMYRPWSYEFQGARSYTAPAVHPTAQPTAQGVGARRRAQSAPLYCYKDQRSGTSYPRDPHNVQEVTYRPFTAHAPQETRDRMLERPTTMIYVYEDGACSNRKYRSAATPGSAGVNKPPEGYSVPAHAQTASFPLPTRNYKISVAPDGSIRRIGMTPAATSLYMNVPEYSSCQRTYTPDTFQSVPYGLQDSDEIAETGNLEYTTDPSYRQSNPNHHGNHGYPAATYRSTGAPPCGGWVSDPYLRNAQPSGATLRNPYMNMVNTTWMV